MSAAITPSMRQWCKDFAKGVRVKTADPLARPVRTQIYIALRRAPCNTISRPMLDKLLYRDLVAWGRAGQTHHVLILTKLGHKEAARRVHER